MPLDLVIFPILRQTQGDRILQPQSAPVAWQAPAAMAEEPSQAVKMLRLRWLKPIL